MACNAADMPRTAQNRSQPAERAPLPAARPSRESMLVDVVVLSSDIVLFEAARESIGERNPVWRARTAAEAADLLVSGRCGVLLVDMGAVSMQGDRLFDQIVGQFPDVVICVAGRRDDEAALVPLITEGRIYRFLHKPLTPKRAAMFLQAAIKRHVERRDELGHVDAQVAKRTGLPTKYFVLLAAVALGFGAMMFSDYQYLPAAANPAGAAAVQSAAFAHTSLPSLLAPRRADPVLSRARAALQAGRLEAPEGRNALDLFKSVLLAQPDNEEARQGLEATVEQLMEQAEQRLGAGDSAEAERLAQRIVSAQSDHEKALALLHELNPPASPSGELARELALAQLPSPPPPLPTSLPGPVTRLDEPATPAPAPTVRSGVRADPLAVRYGEALSGGSNDRPRRAVTLSSGVPAGIQPEVAGYVHPTPRSAEK
jgi:FixJ family two-component response regulator